jgi:ATP-dependent exoDNAse (exonuclease V) beta subunit
VAKLFQLYRSSAGSGKTRTLAKEYLKLALRFRSDYFKHILAVTFTNKSTQEMKDRIMHYLDRFVKGDPDPLADELRTELALDKSTFQERAQEVQSALLHNYHQFSISTIDAFFQKVIRAFTREAGILGDYRLEIEQDLVMEEVVGTLIDELGSHKELTDWVVELALQNLENDRSWDMRQSLIGFSNEIFREEYKSVEEGVEKIAHRKNYFTETRDVLKKQKYSFLNKIKGDAQKVVDHIHALNFSGDDFKYSGGGVYSFLVKVAGLNSVKDFDDRAKGSRSDKEYQVAKNWPEKDHARAGEMIRLAEQQWIPALIEILEYRSKHFPVALSAEVVLNNFYAFGLLTDISRKLGEYKRENNMMLLADAPQFLHGIIRDSDTPFIYEKAGSFYRNFLIDEFQDTSGLQWKNFQPLLANSLDSGYPCMIVGDVKQAIYRWRGGNQDLLQKEVESEMRGDRTETNWLNSNYRSAGQVVSFNNELFKSIALRAAIEYSQPLDEYGDVEQIITKKDDGFVRISFIEETDEEGWKTEALRQATLRIEELQQLGARPEEIAILTRTNREGEEIVSHLLLHKNSEKAKGYCCYDVVSSDSLRIDKAASVNLIVAAITYLLNPDDSIGRAQLAYEQARLHNPRKEMAEVFFDSNPSVFESTLPPAFVKQKAFLKKLPLFELTETLIDIFQLGKSAGELPYLMAFQDQVLDFTSRDRNDLQTFLDWWLENKEKKWIVAPDTASAIKLFTLHKAKGLQFKYVIIPFCSWSLDHDSHGPNLWVRSEHPIFKNMGYLPVRYSSVLKESLFAADYEKELAHAFLDNLNLLYVAFTRAEVGLIVFAPAKALRAKGLSVVKLVHGALQHSQPLNKDWVEATGVYQSGDIAVRIDEKRNEQHSASLATYTTGTWREKLIVKQSPQNRETEESGQRQKINFGIYLHAALSQVIYADDLPGAIAKMESEGTINQNEKENLMQSLSKLLQNPLVAGWFSRPWEVRNETHALLPGGVEFRIDRLLVKDHRAVVIDFKTGVPTQSDQKQVLEYCTMLNQMGFTTEGYLLYLSEGEVVGVQPPKKTKKKNEQQLGLEF